MTSLVRNSYKARNKSFNRATFHPMASFLFLITNKNKTSNIKTLNIYLYILAKDAPATSENPFEFTRLRPSS